MRAFITDDFLLQGKTARALYHQHASAQPVIDYHCHLSPKDIAENRRFRDLTEVWLQGDHYKWRAMRTNGVDERYCTGNATPFEKFSAWAYTVPYTLRNPLYHWTHLELVRHFDINCLLNPETAEGIWKSANAQLNDSDDLTVQGILRRFDVRVVCTTDDPTDSLEHHQAIAKQNFGSQVLPGFRPDAAFRTDAPAEFNAWIDTLSAAANVHIADLNGFLDALKQRHDYFHENGCRVSDHGLDTCPAEFCPETEAASLFNEVRAGRKLSPEQSLRFASFMLLHTAHLDAEKGWVKQLHLGALRNANPHGLKTLGRDSGFDSIGDWNQAPAVARFLARLSEEKSLPKTILYNLNPADNYVFATMIGNFQDGSVAGKIQYGSGWWFLDQKEGMEWQLNALSNCGLLSRFIGMLTDSRSFMSFPRHEYFRRVLCNILGHEIEAGLLPEDEQLVGSMIEAICYGNAAQYFSFPQADTLKMPHAASQ